MKPVKYLSILTVTFSLIGVSNEASAASSYCSNDSKGNETCVVYSTFNKNQMNFLVKTKYMVPVKNFNAIRGIAPVKSSSYSARFSCSPPKTTVTQVKLEDAYGRPIRTKTGTYSNLKFTFKSSAKIIARAICEKLAN